MTDQCITCKIRLSNNYPVPDPDNLPEMPRCVGCHASPYNVFHRCGVGCGEASPSCGWEEVYNCMGVKYDE